MQNRCPICQSESVKKDSKRPTQNRGLIQKYKGKKCNKRFVLDDRFFRMRNSPQKITASIDLFFSGLSTKKSKHILKRSFLTTARI
jgi:transposase-like protein